jgi:hypothetical protein
LNPAGFSVSTIEDILVDAGPGSESFLEMSNRILPAAVVSSPPRLRNRIRLVHYAEADLNDKIRAMAGAQVLEIAMMPFKVCPPPKKKPIFDVSNVLMPTMVKREPGA